MSEIQADFLSKKEHEFLEAMTQLHTIRASCTFLGIKESTGKVRARNIRNKKVKAYNTINRLHAYERKDARLKMILVPIHRREPLEIK